MDTFWSKSHFEIGQNLICRGDYEMLYLARTRQEGHIVTIREITKHRFS